MLKPNVLGNIAIHLLNPTESGNIGAVARAMDNMGLAQLCLLQPHAALNDEAMRRSSGSEHILHNAKIFENLTDQLAPYQWIVGTSNRRRHAEHNLFSMEAFKQALSLYAQQKIAIVFGTESSGLSNQQLDYCHALLKIPCNPNAQSLNLSHAVQVIAYEIRQCLIQPKESDHSIELCRQEEFERLMQHISIQLEANQFFTAGKKTAYMRRIRHLFMRNYLSSNDVQLLLGLVHGLNK